MKRSEKMLISLIVFCGVAAVAIVVINLIWVIIADRPAPIWMLFHILGIGLIHAIGAWHRSEVIARWLDT